MVLSVSLPWLVGQYHFLLQLQIHSCDSFPETKKAPVIFKTKTASALECLIQFGGKKAEAFSDFLLSNAVKI